MKIVLVHEEYPEETNFGGIATYQKNVAEEYVKMGNSVSVICRGLSRDNDYWENGVHIIRIFVPTTKNKKRDYILYRKRVSKELLKMQNHNMLDIIETPDWGAETIYFESYRKVPLVVRLHTPLKIWLKYNSNDFGMVKSLLLKWEDKLIRSADLVTCCSDALKQEFLKSFLPLNQTIYVTPNPANIVDFYYDSNVLKKDYLLFVGSLEERKGVITLAKALNLVFAKYPNLRIRFIGKDTIRNCKNISTVKYICNEVLPEYVNRLEFLGQLPNKQINFYLNESAVGIFPSLFDNFPYVVLEAMSTGLQIVGSRNSGMVEMLGDNGAIYKSGDYADLANRIIAKYEEYIKIPVDNNQISRLHDLFSPNTVCTHMLSLYQQTLSSYHSKKVSRAELERILSDACINDKISFFRQENAGVSNLVYYVRTRKRKNYLIKKYLHDYDFGKANKLYELYKKYNIDTICPLNKEVIEYSGFKYNVFKYVKSDFSNTVDTEYFKKVLCCDRTVLLESNLVYKCDKYFEYLSNTKKFINGLSDETVKYVLKNYDIVRTNKIFLEQSLNHGDISPDNIITSRGKKYLIDFDETIVSSCLYDFAVIVIKFYTRGDQFVVNEYISLRDNVKQYYLQYSDQDFFDMVEFYLCKILLEKFYLHQIKSIDLYSNRQLRDDYRKYLRLLKNISVLEVKR